MLSIDRSVSPFDRRGPSKVPTPPTYTTLESRSTAVGNNKLRQYFDCPAFEENLLCTDGDFLLSSIHRIPLDYNYNINEISWNATATRFKKKLRKIVFISVEIPLHNIPSFVPRNRHTIVFDRCWNMEMGWPGLAINYHIGRVLLMKTSNNHNLSGWQPRKCSSSPYTFREIILLIYRRAPLSEFRYRKTIVLGLSSADLLENSRHSGHIVILD